MTADLGPGTLLVCVDASGAPPGARGTLTHGAIYRVARVIRGCPGRCPHDACGDAGLELVERPPTPGIRFYLYCPNRFRPLNDGDTSLVRGVARDMADLIMETYGP